jgi:ATP-binding cassette, subfamily F, member 3
MSLITINDLAKSYGPNDIFTQVSASIPQRARIGLVGPNGVGKTTLLRILLGLEEASEGAVHRARGLTIGYLPQEASFDTDGVLWDACLTVFNDLRKRQKELEILEGKMSDPAQAEAALESYGKLQHEFELQGGYTYETRIRQTLTGLGFAANDLHRPLSQLSGGQRTRALLARLLLSSPDLLLLDEPTNHLDISAVEWLEDYLADWPGAVLIVSHDRYFLDRVVNTVWEMSPAFESYHGNYSAYLRQRGERYQKRLEEYQVQAAFIEKEEEYIRRNIAGQNTRQAQGRRKRLERLLEEARLTPPAESRRLHLNLQPVGRSGDLVLQTRELQVGYADEGRPLFSVPNLTLRRRECAAILGPNGAGKTTFLKTLLNQIPPWQGEATLGASLKIGYFAQAHEGLRPQNTLFDEIQRAAPQMKPEEIRSYLARFLFSGDDVFKKVEVLSGGERGRLALACLALTGSNLLLLDEPTNHLDLPSQEVLQSILADFQGTILLVSHDRYLIDALATQIWEVFPTEKRLQVFEGTYSEYRADRAVAQPAKAGAVPPTAARIEQEKSKPVSTKSNKNSERLRQQNMLSLEKEISELEGQLVTLSAQLEKPPVDGERVNEMGQEYVRLQEELEDLLAEWERNAESL